MCRAAFTELLALKPNDIASLNNFAYMLVESITPPEPAAAKQYSQRAYELSRTSGSPNDYIFDSHAWILILNGGADAAEGIKILEGVVKRQADLIDAHYHLGEGYLRQPRPSKQFAKVELNKAMELVRKQEAAGLKVDKAMKDRIATALERATDGAREDRPGTEGFLVRGRAVGRDFRGAPSCRFVAQTLRRVHTVIGRVPGLTHG